MWRVVFTPPPPAQNLALDIQSKRRAVPTLILDRQPQPGFGGPPWLPQHYPPYRAPPPVQDPSLGFLSLRRPVPTLLLPQIIGKGEFYPSWRTAPVQDPALAALSKASVATTVSLPFGQNLPAPATASAPWLAPPPVQAPLAALSKSYSLLPPGPDPLQAYLPQLRAFAAPPPVQAFVPSAAATALIVDMAATDPADTFAADATFVTVSLPPAPLPAPPRAPAWIAPPAPQGFVPTSGIPPITVDMAATDPADTFAGSLSFALAVAMAASDPADTFAASVSYAEVVNMAATDPADSFAADLTGAAATADGSTVLMPGGRSFTRRDYEAVKRDLAARRRKRAEEEAARLAAIALDAAKARAEQARQAKARPAPAAKPQAAPVPVAAPIILGGFEALAAAAQRAALAASFAAAAAEDDDDDEAILAALHLLQADEEALIRLLLEDEDA